MDIMDVLKPFSNVAKPLQIDENNELAMQAKNSEEKMAEFISHNLLLVKKTISESHIFLSEDYLQAGIMGLIQAVKNYDISKGAISTYSKYWIRNSLYKLVNDEADIYYGRTFAKTRKNTKQLLDKIFESGIETGSETYNLLLESHGLTQKKIDEIMSYDYSVSRFEEIDETSVSDSSIEYDSVNSLFRKELSDIVSKAMADSLTELETDILMKCFGFNGTQEKCSHIARERGVTKQAVLHAKSRAIEKLKKNKEIKNIKDVFYL